MALDYDNISAFVGDKILPVLADNIFNSSYLLKQMKARSDVMEGNTTFRAPLLYAKGRSGAYAEWDLLDVRPKDTRTAAEFSMASLYANMTISKQQEMKTSGNEAVLNLLNIEAETAEKTLIDDICTDLYNDGSNSINPHGLRKIINYDRSLGGIDSTSDTWWDAIVAADVDSNYTTTNLSAANLNNPSSDYYILTVMRKIWLACQHNAEHPDGVYMSSGMYSIYEQVLLPFASYKREPTAAVKMAADGGFQVLEYKGVPVVYDEFCPDGFIFMTNSKYLNMKIHSKDNFTLGPWQKPVNQQARIAQITASLQFITTNSRYLGRIECASTIG